jgi:hypothetical protein
VMTATAPDGGTLGSGVGCMLDAGAPTGGEGDSPGVCGGATSAGWQHGGMELRGVCGGAQGGSIVTCAAVLPQHCREAVAVQCHHTAAEDSGDWAGQGGVGSCHCWVKYDNQLVGATRSIPGDAFWRTMAGLGWHH